MLFKKNFILLLGFLCCAACASAPPKSPGYVSPATAVGVVQERVQQDVIIVLNPYPGEAEDFPGFLADDIIAASGLLVGKETQIIADRFMVTAHEGERWYLHFLNDARGYYGKGHKVELAFPLKKLAVVDFAAPAGDPAPARRQLQVPLTAYLRQSGHYTLIDQGLTAAALKGRDAPGGLFLEAAAALELGRKLGADLVYTAEAALNPKEEWTCRVRLFQVNNGKALLDKTYK